MNNNTELKCLKCGSIIRSGAKFCTNCGSQVATSLNNINKVIVKSSDFPLIYNNSDDSILEYFLSLELKKAGIDEKTSLIPENLSSGAGLILSVDTGLGISGVCTEGFSSSFFVTGPA